MDTVAIELNKFLGFILDVVYEFGGNRTIVFTSFSPEACMALAIKQKTYPILFLVESFAGHDEPYDRRAIGVQTAMHFARHCGISGVIIRSDPFILSSSLVGKVHDRGLICWSYGNLNEDPNSALIQAEAVLDVIIVNKVRLISTTLRERHELLERTKGITVEETFV
ncbi:Glycerophosphodiester phosphodiesterase GDE1 [Podospora fimiseda]|uniref:Glycerophosphodiester phosphodiesterase GDE1 n=1 Tax=Podospora fimiseda TaxID=252190 RepID=A0AAN7BFG3_9PEZI|nr:Glycerophosphodiester phosphodiesterase GDE1 [Podospora fimiseda]